MRLEIARVEHGASGAVARITVETTASTKSADSDNGQICPIFISYLRFSPIFLNES
jgi:hypothetical protein